MGFRDKINYAPVVVTGIIIAFHNIAYGVGYLFDSSGFPTTILYKHAAELMAPELFGLLMLLTGLLALYAWLKRKDRLVSLASNAQALTWLFATLIYVINGDITLGISIGLVWTLLAYYMGYVYRHRVFSHYDD